MTSIMDYLLRESVPTFLPKSGHFEMECFTKSEYIRKVGSISVLYVSTGSEPIWSHLARCSANWVNVLTAVLTCAYLVTALLMCSIFSLA